MAVQIGHFLVFVRFGDSDPVVFLELSYLLLRPKRFGLIERTVDSPFYDKWLTLVLCENLINHGLSRELSEVSVLILNKRDALVAVEVDVFNFSPRREELVEESDHISHWRN